MKYYGNTEFGPGLWCGVELDDPLGKNDGSVAGIRFVIHLYDRINCQNNLLFLFYIRYW